MIRSPQTTLWVVISLLEKQKYPFADIAHLTFVDHRLKSPGKISTVMSGQ